MRLLPRTLRSRLTVLYAVSLAVVLVACDGLCYVLVRREILRHHDHELEEAARKVQEVLAGGNDDVLTPHQRAQLDRMGRLILLHGEGSSVPQIFYRSPSALDELQVRAIRGTGPPGLAPFGDFTTTSGSPALRIYSLPFRSPTGEPGVILVAEAVGDARATLDSVALAMLLLLPLVAVAAPALGNWLARRALAPVAAVSLLAREIEATNLSLRLPAGGSGHEMDQLVETFNQMIARLERTFEAMKRFTADASHELRAPLASMRSAVDVALTRPRDDGEYREVLSAIGEDVDRLRSITEDLLVLARADAGRVVLEHETLRLDSLAADAVESLLSIAQDRGIELGMTASIPVTVSGDERWLRQLLTNLIDNALKYAPRAPHADRPAAVTVSVYSADGLATLAVQDTGPGLADDTLGHLFERFFRGDRARPYARGDGAGLGLAIADWIVKAHAGTISGENLPGGGCRFIVRLPLASVS